MDRGSRSRFRDAGRLVQNTLLRPAYPPVSHGVEQPRAAYELDRTDEIGRADDRPPRPFDRPYASSTPGSYNPNQQQTYQGSSYPQYQHAQQQPYQHPPAPQYTNPNDQQGYGAPQQGNSGGSYNGYHGSPIGQTQPNQGQYPQYASQQDQSYSGVAPYSQGASSANSSQSVLPPSTGQTQPNQSQYLPYPSQPNQAYGMGPPYNQGTSTANSSHSVPPSGSPFHAPGHQPLSRASTIGGYSSTSSAPPDPYCTRHGEYMPCRYCPAYP